MTVNISFSQSYHWLNSWILGNVIQLATQDFCDRFIGYDIDPGDRLYDQMTMAARCGVANIAEGSGCGKRSSVLSEMREADATENAEKRTDARTRILGLLRLSEMQRHPADREALIKNPD